jgi:hypothetical protein
MTRKVCGDGRVRAALAQLVPCELPASLWGVGDVDHARPRIDGLCGSQRLRPREL